MWAQSGKAEPKPGRKHCERSHKDKIHLCKLKSSGPEKCFFATYVENSAPVASLSGEYEELVLFDLHLLKWDQFCISAVHYNTVYVIDNLQNGLTYKECFAQLFHFWPLKENKMIQAGRRKFQQFLSCFKCNWKKKKVLENKESGILLPCYDTGVFMQQRMEIFVCSSSRADQKHVTNMFIKKKKKNWHHH